MKPEIKKSAEPGLYRFSLRGGRGLPAPHPVGVRQRRGGYA